MAQSQAVQSARTSPGRILAIGERQDSVSGLWPTLGVEARDIVAVASEDEALRRIQDEDFAAMIVLGTTGPPIVWVRIGNTRRGELIDWFDAQLDEIVALIEAGNRILELR